MRNNTLLRLSLSLCVSAFIISSRFFLFVSVGCLSSRIIFNSFFIYIRAMRSSLVLCNFSFKLKSYAKIERETKTNETLYTMNSGWGRGWTIIQDEQTLEYIQTHFYFRCDIIRPIHRCAKSCHFCSKTVCVEFRLFLLLRFSFLWSRSPPKQRFQLTFCFIFVVLDLVSLFIYLFAT